MPPWFSLQGALTSAAWRPCSPPSIIVRSYLTPHHGTHLTTWTGGRASSDAPMLPGPSPDPSPSSTTEPSQMQAQALVWPSRLAQGGVHGSLSMDGSPREGTSSGQRQSDLSTLPSAYALWQEKGSTSHSTGTIGESSRGGGKAAVQTDPQTGCSVASFSLQKIAAGHFTPNTSLASKTPQMPHPVAYTPPPSSCSMPSQYPAMLGPSSWTSNPGEVARGVALRGLVRPREGAMPTLESELRAVKQQKTHPA